MTERSLVTQFVAVENKAGDQNFIAIMSLILYYFRNCPFCRTVLTVGNELGIKFELRHVDLWKKEHLSEDFLKINPQHSVPVLVDGDFILPNCRTIAQYLVDKVSPGNALYPKDLKLRAQVHRYLYFDDSNLVPVTRPVFVPVLNDGLDSPPAQAVNDFKEKLEQINLFLEGKNYLVGDSKTIADIALNSTLSLVRMVDYDFSEFPNLDRWLKRLREELPYTEELATKFTSELKELAAKNKAEKTSG